MKLDKDEMFGFNVKVGSRTFSLVTAGTLRLIMSSFSLSRAEQGGSDQNLPVIVTRVAPKTPADGLLNEGDQVISVNGHKVAGITHEQVHSRSWFSWNAAYVDVLIHYLQFS